MIRLSIAPLLLCCALLYSLPVHAQDAAPKYKFVEYKVVKGDTCIGIARKVYGNGRLCFKMISKYNKMNRKFVIVTGRVLQLPTKEELGVESTGPDAIVTDRKGDVESRAPKKTSWSRAQRGEELYTLWRVNSGKSSSAEVTFTENDSALQMRENTLVIIYGPRKEKSRRVGSKAILERGTLRSRMAALSEKKKTSLTVETQAATTTVGSGEAVFSVAKQGVTRVANHTATDVSMVGKDAPEPEEVKKRKKKRRKKKRKIVRLPQNMGSKIIPGKDPSPPKPLPPAPEWASATPSNILAIGSTNSHTLEWKPVKVASRYRVELLNDADGRQVMDQFFVSGRYDSIKLQNLPPQTYYVRIASIDADEFEGRPSAVHQLNFIPATLKRAAAIKQDNGIYYVGSSIDIQGARCTADEDKERSASLVFATAGERALSCVDEKGQALAPMKVTIREMRVDGLSFASPLPLRPDFTQQVTFSTAPSANDVSFALPEGVELISKTQLEDGRWQANFKRTPDAKVSVQQVKVYLGEAAQGVQIATVPLEILAQERVQELSVLRVFDTWTLGGFTQLNALHSDAYEVDGAQAGPGLRVGLDGRYTPLSWIGLGARLSVGDNEMERQERSFNAFGLSAYGNLNVLTGSIRPHLRLGTGVEMVRFDSDYSVQTQSWSRGERDSDVFIDHHGGIGLDLMLTPRILFNASVMQHVLPWGDELSMYSSMSIGASGLF